MVRCLVVLAVLLVGSTADAKGRRQAPPQPRAKAGPSASAPKPARVPKGGNLIGRLLAKPARAKRKQQLLDQRATREKARNERTLELLKTMPESQHRLHTGTNKTDLYRSVDRALRTAGTVERHHLRQLLLGPASGRIFKFGGETYFHVAGSPGRPEVLIHRGTLRVNPRYSGIRSLGPRSFEQTSKGGAIGFRLHGERTDAGRLVGDGRQVVDEAVSRAFFGFKTTVTQTGAHQFEVTVAPNRQSLARGVPHHVKSATRQPVRISVDPSAVVSGLERVTIHTP